MQRVLSVTQTCSVLELNVALEQGWRIAHISSINPMPVVVTSSGVPHGGQSGVTYFVLERPDE